jgi:hypothetical protein
MAIPWASLGISKASAKIPASSRSKARKTITARGILLVLGRLKPVETQRFERHLLHYHRTDFVLDLLETASKAQEVDSDPSQLGRRGA